VSRKQGGGEKLVGIVGKYDYNNEKMYIIKGIAKCEASVYISRETTGIW
jgi:hypothetical protein